MEGVQEKTRAAAAPRKPKNGAVSSPLKAAITVGGSATTSDRSEKFDYSSVAVKKAWGVHVHSLYSRTFGTRLESPLGRVNFLLASMRWASKPIVILHFFAYYHFTSIFQSSTDIPLS